MSENNKRKKLSNTQIELLEIKLKIISQKELDFMKALNTIAFEQGISKKDLANWRLNKEGTHLEVIKKGK